MLGSRPGPQLKGVRAQRGGCKLPINPSLLSAPRNIVSMEPKGPPLDAINKVSEAIGSQTSAYLIRDANEDDLPGILEIFNDAILNTTANWSYDTVDIEDRRAWMRSLKAKSMPIIVAVAATGGDNAGASAAAPSVLGYACYGPFRERHGYRFTVETTIYTHHSARGGGIGSSLMTKLIDRAKNGGVHTLIAVVADENEGSVRFHERFGFVVSARMPELGYKFGRWLDLVYLQLTVPIRAEALI